MFRSLPVFIGLRYTRAKRRNHFISFISATSMVGLTLGVAVLILVLSVMNGFDRELRQRILGMVPHATLQSYSSFTNWQQIAPLAEQHPHVEASAPFIQAQGMLTRGGEVRGVMVNGVLPDQEQRVSIIEQHMVEGSLESLKPGEFGIILGDFIARFLGVGVGERVTLVLPEASISPAGVFPRLKRFHVVGTFKVGAELDGSLALTHMDDMSRLLRLPPGDIHGLRLKLDDLFRAPQVAWDLVHDLPGDYRATDWTRTHGNLFNAIQMEKTMIGLLLLIIVAVAAFNIVSTLVMVVTDKQADIAILRTIGATPRTIMGVFMVQGSVIGVFGTLLGTLFGIGLALTVSDIVAWLERVLNVEFLRADVYFISYLPSELRWEDVTLISAAALLMSFLSTIYPAWRASRVQPAEALRYE